jgi:hypothetical protein
MSSSFFTSGKRKRAPSQSTPVIDLRSKVRTGSLRTSDIGSSALRVSTAPVRKPVILKSAYLPPASRRTQPKWTRNSPMTRYSFVRTIADVSSSGVVEFSDSTEHEDIEIASDWKTGESLYDDKESHVKTGFIGKGFTKRGIYVSS